MNLIDLGFQWDAVEDFVKRSTINAASGVRGVYIQDKNGAGELFSGAKL